MGEKFEDKNLMLELCKKHELDLYQATLSDMEYKIIRKQILTSGKEISTTPTFQNDILKELVEP